MTSNPMTNDRIYEGIIVSDKPMTVAGTVNKTLGLLAIVVLVASYTWHLAYTGMADKLQAIMMTGIIGGLILAIIAAFKPQHSKPLSIGYAACEGLALGGISAYFNAAFPGIVAQAILGTFVAMAIVLLLFKTRVIRATEAFRSTIIAATISIAVLYGISLIMGLLFRNTALSAMINSSGTLGLVFSGIVIIIASLNFVLDFDFIERGVEQGAPQYLEWYGAFSLLVTLIWLYLEILRLLAKLQNRR